MQAAKLAKSLASDGDVVPTRCLGWSRPGRFQPVTWFDPGELTYSFAPDGTEVAGQASNLFEQLSALGEPAQWQAETSAK